jgi:hypothetical protein
MLELAQNFRQTQQLVLKEIAKRKIIEISVEPDALPHVSVIAAAVHRGYSWPGLSTSLPGASWHRPAFFFRAVQCSPRGRAAFFFRAAQCSPRGWAAFYFRAVQCSPRGRAAFFFRAVQCSPRGRAAFFFRAVQCSPRGQAAFFFRAVQCYPLTHSASGQIFLGLPDFSRA